MRGRQRVKREYNNSSILKMELIFSSETSAYFNRTTWRYNPEDCIIHSHRLKNIKCNTIMLFALSSIPLMYDPHTMEVTIRNNDISLVQRSLVNLCPS
jgi:hypothetical protein